MPLPKIFFINANVIDWLKEGHEIKAHALFSDLPYHLRSMFLRFGKVGAKPPKIQDDGSFARAAAGFMGKQWDTDFAYKIATWKLFQKNLHPGAFCVTYSHARQFDLLLHAQRQAGMIVNPAFFVNGTFYELPNVSAWTYASGKPTGTKVSTFLEGSTGKWAGYQYGSPIKPAWEPICWTQAPYPANRKVYEVIDETGAGALNIEGGKAFKNNNKFPDTYLPVHHPLCRYRGIAKVKNKSGSVEEDPNAQGHVNTYEGETGTSGYEQPEYIDVPQYDCHPDCQCRGWPPERLAYFFQGDWNFEAIERILAMNPVFYHGKVTKKERNAFLEHLPDLVRQRANPGGYAATDPKWMDVITKNNHPTLKPIKLNYYLASLILPPVEYAPRILIIPCSGVGSEIIGAALAGWDIIIAIEIGRDYHDLSRHRVAGWMNLIRYGNIDVDNIIATAFAEDSFLKETVGGQLSMF
jgi:hypothetical protein